MPIYRCLERSIFIDEYISKDRVLCLIYATHSADGFKTEEDYLWLQEAVVDAAIADVQPIVYAHKTINVGRRSYCSNCGKLAIMEDFCSKCGAKVKDGNLTEERKEYHDNTTSFPTEPPFNYCGEKPID